MSIKDEAKRIEEAILGMPEYFSSRLTQASNDVDKSQEILENTEKGDTSENATLQNNRAAYKKALNDYTNFQKRKEAFTYYIDNEMSHIPSDTIKLNSTIELTLLNNKTELDPHFYMRLVPHDLGDASRGLLAVDSAVGQAVLGRHTGDIVDVKAIHGIVKYQIGDVY